MKWQPLYQMTSQLARDLKRIEVVKEKTSRLTLDDNMLTSVRDIVRLNTVYHSTIIEGSCLEPDQITAVISGNISSIPDEKAVQEIQGYHAALLQVEQWAAESIPVTEKSIQTLYAMIMAGDQTPTKSSSYRKGQNVVYNNRTNAIAYMPPEAEAVPKLMKRLVHWINENHDFSCPIVAAIAHHQLVSIHPYYHANGRVARLLVSLILYNCNKLLRGLFSLEKYYTSNSNNYFNALCPSPSHNYYVGRAKAEITPWIQYAVEGIALSFEEAYKRLLEVQSKGFTDHTTIIQKLAPKQRKALGLFREFDTVDASQIKESLINKT
jgi:Fic family protein